MTINIWNLFTRVFVTNATYNSLREQVAYCKMQGFDTVSRNTSLGPSLYTSGTVWIGVGLSHIQFQGELCGMCIEVDDAHRLASGNEELTEFNPSKPVTRFPFLAMVFDECTDPICESGWLDFDVYTPEPPVPAGNPYNVVWKAVPCPVHDAHGLLLHRMEYLVCFKTTCKKQDDSHTGKTFGDVWDPTFFGIVIRNARVPIISVKLNQVSLQYVSGFGWMFSGRFVDSTLSLEMMAVDGSTVTDHLGLLSDIKKMSTQPAYHGGVLIQSRQNI